MCNKMAFDSKSDARKHAHQIKVNVKFKSRAYAHSNFTGSNLSVYECPACSKWHLTSTGRLKGKRLKARNKRILKTNNECLN